MLLGERLRRLVAQKLQVLAQHPARQGRVDDVVHESTPSGHLNGHKKQQQDDPAASQRERREGVAITDSAEEEPPNPYMHPCFWYSAPRD